MGLKAASRKTSGNKTAKESTQKAAQQVASAKKKRSRKATPAEMEQLIVENREVAIRIGWKLLSRWRVRLESDELESVVGIALCEAANRFDYSYDTSFKTFLFYHLRGLLIKEISTRVNDRKLLHVIPTARLSEGDQIGSVFASEWPRTLVEKRNPEKLMQVKQRADLCRSAYAVLDDLERQVVERFFVNDESLTSIAEDLGYCRCHLSRVKTQALNNLGRALNLLAPTDESFAAPARLKKPLNKRKKKSYKGGRGRRKRASQPSDSPADFELKKAV